MGPAMRLDVSPLRAAVGQLGKSLAYLDSDLARGDPDLREQFRAAAILCFGHVYELATKMVRRQLEQQALSPAEARRMEFMALMRAAADAGLVGNPADWHGYRDLRNRTSHTYDQAEAEAVVERLGGFLAEARRVTSALESRNRA